MLRKIYSTTCYRRPIILHFSKFEGENETDKQAHLFIHELKNPRDVMLNKVQVVTGSDCSNPLSSLGEFVVQHVHRLVDEDEGVHDGLSVCRRLWEQLVGNWQEVRSGVLWANQVIKSGDCKVISNFCGARHDWLSMWGAQEVYHSSC